MDPAQLAYLQALRWHQAHLHGLSFSPFIGVIIYNAAAIIHAQYLQQPWHTSMLTGQKKIWVLELLGGHPECICTELGVHTNVLYSLIDELHSFSYTDSKFVTLQEQLAIFLYCSVTGLMVRHMGEWSQMSYDTITLWVSQNFKYELLFTKILLAISRKWLTFSHHHHSTQTMWNFPLQMILFPQRYNKMPYFKDALGVIDGSQINFVAPASLHDIYQNWKGYISQNCLFSHSFGL